MNITHGVNTNGTHRYEVWDGEEMTDVVEESRRSYTHMVVTNEGKIVTKHGNRALAVKSQADNTEQDKRFPRLETYTYEVVAVTGQASIQATNPNGAVFVVERFHEDGGEIMMDMTRDDATFVVVLEDWLRTGGVLGGSHGPRPRRGHSPIVIG